MNNVIFSHQSFKVDKKIAQFCVVGGGMAGLCAALAAARHGVKTLLIQDRPVLGGNASSEIRMWICGAEGIEAKEGGLLEEIQLRNMYYNRDLKYTIWDDVLYGLCKEEINLEVIFNCSVNEVNKEVRAIRSIKAWHLTRQCWIEVEADVFSDCSGDSVLSICGAEMRAGRESRQEFNECHAQIEADNKTMGNSILIQLREVSEHKPFVPPKWAIKFNEKDLENRGLYPKGNFWWLEIGGLMDTIDDADKIRDENLAIAYGAWDLIKNHPDGRGHGWELEWIGALPGKRENLRYVGDVVITQNDIESEGRHFDDIVCHGGWPMDDHHPDAIKHRGAPTVFHPAPSPYGIPFRSLYSKDMDNLFCAGRNISATHMAMSSTRVMGTTSVMGQAVGTAAHLAIKYNLSARSIYQEKIDVLKKLLQDDDQYLPFTKRPCLAATMNVSLEGHPNADLLFNGFDRDLGGKEQGVWLNDGQVITMKFPKPTFIEQLRMVFDSDFKHVKRMPCSFPKKGNGVEMPAVLIKKAIVEILDEHGKWHLTDSIEDNHLRLIKSTVQKRIKALRLHALESWGGKGSRLFSLDVS